MDKNKGVFQALEQLQSSDYYPFHMPGHKRNMENHVLSQAYGMDITEIDGFDNLHDPQGMILESMELARGLYGTKKTWFLVNGSTVGILASIYACVKPGGKILVARNCHKAVYNAVALLNLEARYLYPEMIPNWNIAGSIFLEDVQNALEQDSDIQAVAITSPTYDGIASPIKEMADIVHKKGIPLIVDEAHGAHFLFHKAFPESALQQGADLVIHSIHKTLPAFTQTALLHLQGNLVQSKKVERYLSAFQSSSPSYLLMGGIDYCIRLVGKEREKLWTDILRQAQGFYQKMQTLRYIKVFYEKAGRSSDEHYSIEAKPLLETAPSLPSIKKDPLKLIISVQNTERNKRPYTGYQLYQELLDVYHLQMEMAADTYVLGILTCMDKEEGLLRLEKALAEIDQSLAKQEKPGIQGEKNIIPTKADLYKEIDTVKTERQLQTIECIAAALEQPQTLVDLQDAVGKESGCFLNLYPPGIPLIVPGEVISQELVDKLIQYRRQGLALQGLTEDKVTIIDKTF